MTTSRHRYTHHTAPGILSHTHPPSFSVQKGREYQSRARAPAEKTPLGPPTPPHPNTPPACHVPAHPLPKSSRTLPPLVTKSTEPPPITPADQTTTIFPDLAAPPLPQPIKRLSHTTRYFSGHPCQPVKHWSCERGITNPPPPANPSPP